MKLYPKISLFFIIWLAAVILTAFLSFSTLPHSGKFSDNFWESFGNWDGGHFLGIAEQGYKEKFQFAFFPLYPLLIRLLNQITGNYLLAAILISLVSTYLGMQLLYKLVLEDFKKEIAEKTILFLLFFPTSFYFLAAYSEGLFFFLTIATFYFLKKKRLFLATLTVSLVSATRLIGLAVVAVFLIEIGINQGFNRKNWYTLLAPGGFILYCWFLQTQTGDPFYFIVSEVHWQRLITVPVSGFWETLKSLVQPGFISGHFNSFLDLLFAVFGLGLVIRTFRFLPSSYSLYSLFSIGLPLFTPSLSSMPRFLLVIFPIFILIAFTKNRYFILAYQMISLMLLSAFIVLYINGYWVG